jgi:phosphoglycerate dehydrogenase-like enzyme
MTCILWGIFYFSSGEQFASSRKDLPVPTRILTLVLIALAALTANPGLGQDLAGSTESTVVALDTQSGTRPLVYLGGRLSEDEQATLAEVAPNVEFLVGLSEEEALAQAGRIQGADAHLLTDEFLAAAPDLRWAQSWSAGVTRYLEHEGLRDNDRIVLSNMKGVHGPAIAEHVFAMLLSMTRDLDAYRKAQDQAEWNRRAGSGMTTLSGRTMLVVGMGGIGSQIARRAKGFDMKVLATVRTARPAPDYCDELGTAADLDRFLPLADVVAVALPLTEETTDLFNAEKFALMKPGAYFLNVGRGRIVVTDDLLAALDSGHLAGAGLDVTEPEPLPADHPLWKSDKVLITPHVSSHAELTGERRWDVFQENIRRFAAGEPLLNVVDKQLGY